MDKYTKVVLTLIAFALWANLFVSLSPPGRGLISDAHAQGLNYVVIRGIQLDPTLGPNQVLPVAVRPSDPAPVYLTAGPNSSNPIVIPVNLAQIGAKWMQQGAAMPVDIEGIAGAPVKASGGLPVALTSPQPLAITAKDPLQVVVTKLPVSPAAVPNQMPSQYPSGSSTTTVPGGGPGSQ
jgi:hypothetical protein